MIGVIVVIIGPNVFVIMEVPCVSVSIERKVLGSGVLLATGVEYTRRFRFQSDRILPRHPFTTFFKVFNRIKKKFAVEAIRGVDFKTPIK